MVKLLIYHQNLEFERYSFMKQQANLIKKKNIERNSSAEFQG